MRRDIIRIIRSGDYNHADVEELLDLAERACLLAAAAWPVVERVSDEGYAILRALDEIESPLAYDVERAYSDAVDADALYDRNVYDDDVLEAGEALAGLLNGNDELPFRGVWRDER